MYNNLLRLAQEYQWYRYTNGTGVPMVILILYFNPFFLVPNTAGSYTHTPTVPG